MIAVINYGLGNLHSVQKAITFVGGKAIVTDDPDTILKANKVVLPGVGAFEDGMRGLISCGLDDTIKEIVRQEKPLLGICLGMQLFFEESEEQGQHTGLGLLQGKVRAFQQPGIKVPQIGWNQLEIVNHNSLMKDIPPSSYVYFNHGYYCDPIEQTEVLSMTNYGIRFASSVQKENLFGVQFHPEKSQRIGLKILQNFVEL